MGAEAVVGVLHALVPYHWVPITVNCAAAWLVQTETVRAALQAGAGHVLSTLASRVPSLLVGGGAANRLGATVDAVSSFC